MTEFSLLQWISTYFGVWKIRNYVANLPITFLSLATTNFLYYSGFQLTLAFGKFGTTLLIYQLHFSV